MKRINRLIALPILALGLSACDLLPSGGSGSHNYDKEIESVTSKWVFLDENKSATNNYFIFDGSENVMSFKYYENDSQKYSGTFRIVTPSEKGKDASYTFMWCLNKKDGQKEDVIICYSDNFSATETSFTQFTVLKISKKLAVYEHIYRISELPYKVGTYVKEGHSYQVEDNNFCYADYYQIPSGTYHLDEDTSITFLTTKPYRYALFSYTSGNITTEGVFNTGTNTNPNDRMYLYIQHDPYTKVSQADKAIYDTTFSAYYPPDVFLYGTFQVSNNSVSISEVIFQEHAPAFGQGYWKTGAYTK